MLCQSIYKFSQESIVSLFFLWIHNINKQFIWFSWHRKELSFVIGFSNTFCPCVEKILPLVPCPFKHDCSKNLQEKYLIGYFPHSLLSICYISVISTTARWKPRCPRTLTVWMSAPFSKKKKKKFISLKKKKKITIFFLVKSLTCVWLFATP